MRIMFLNHTHRREGGPEREERILKLLNSYASPGTVVEIHYPDDLGGGDVQHQTEQGNALAGLHHVLETPALVKKILEAERAGFDAVIQSNTFDPGVEAARLAVRIPVVGVLRSSCQFAACLCDRFGLIAPTDSYVPYVWRLVESYRMAKFVSEIRALKFSEHDIPGQRALAVERIVTLGREMIAAGAQAIIPLGGNVVPYQIFPEELEPQIGAPVINTKAVGIRFAELMVFSRVTHSQKAYPWAPGLNPDAVVQRS